MPRRASSQKALALILVFAVTAALLATLIVQSFQARLQAQKDLEKRAEAIFEASLTLERSLGFGGFIHNFKNAVLRPEERARYAAAADQDLAQINRVLADLPVIVPESAEAVERVRTVLLNYEANLGRLTDLAEADPLALDKVVRVADEEAITGLQALLQLVLEEERQAIIAAARVPSAIVVYLVLLGSLVTAALLVFLRLSQRLDRARALAESRESLIGNVQKIIENVTSSLALVAPDGRIILSNTRARAELPDIFDTADGRVPAQFRQNDPQADALSRALAGAEMRDAIIRRDQPGGGSAYLRVSSRPVTLGDVGAAQFIDVRDITEALIGLRMQSRQQALTTVGQMASGAAHDFRNIIGTLRMLLDTLRKRDLGEREASIVQTALQALEVGDNLTSGLMGVAKGNRDTARVTAIRDVVEALSLLAQHILPETVVLSMAEVPETARVLVEEAALTNALLNLVINAQEAISESGTGGRITVAVLPALVVLDQPGWAIEVRDNGPGFSPEALGNLGRMFFTTKPEGTGIGLNMVQVFADDHAGILEAENTAQGGAVVRLVLPAVAEAGAGLRVGARLKRVLAGKRVVFVEDDPVVFEVIRSGLQAAGAEVAAFVTGEDALAHMQQTGFDLLITDLELGPSKVQGYDLLEWHARERPGQPSIIHSKSEASLQADFSLLGAFVVRKGQSGVALEEAILRAFGQGQRQSQER